MNGTWYVIDAATLQDISDAIRLVKNLHGYIPVDKLADALAGMAVETTQPMPLATRYMIKYQTLEDIANVLRRLEGSAGNIHVYELAARIRALAGIDIDTLKSVYYGTAEEPSVYTSEFVLSLTEERLSSKETKFTVNAGESQYIYYCVPAYGAGFGDCTFYESGFKGGFTKVDTVRVTAGAYPVVYYVYRSDNAGLGETTINVL